MTLSVTTAEAERRVILGRSIETQLARTTDGRTLSFCRFGETGPALFYFHGGASCRFEAATGVDGAAHAGCQIISADRPGYGLSTDRRLRGLRDWADDVAALADALGLDRFHVGGVSAGAPFALAVAAALPDRVDGVFALNTAASPFVPAWKRVSFAVRAQVMLLRSIPGAAEHLYSSLRRNPAAAYARLKQAPEADRKLAAADGGEFLQVAIAEGLRQGVRATVGEFKLIYNRPWDVAWQDVAAPVRITQGREDLMLPFVREIAATYPKVTLTEIEGGHLGAGAPEVWVDIFESVAPRTSEPGH